MVFDIEAKHVSFGLRLLHVHTAGRIWFSVWGVSAPEALAQSSQKKQSECELYAVPMLQDSEFLKLTSASPFPVKL